MLATDAARSWEFWRGPLHPASRPEVIEATNVQPNVDAERSSAAGVAAGSAVADRPRRWSTCTTRSSTTHWARSSSGVHMHTFATRGSRAAKMRRGGEPIVRRRSLVRNVSRFGPPKPLPEPQLCVAAGDALLESIK